jgi:hypothetical protein
MARMCYWESAIGKIMDSFGLKRYLCLMHPVQFIYAKT